MSENHEIIQRFARESQIVRDLSHPGIVPIHGLGRAARSGLFLVMELVSGQNLDQVVRTREISVRLTADWLLQAARIVHFANERGVIHCYLKLGNLLLDESSKIRVTDFGFTIQSPGFLASRLDGTPAFIISDASVATGDPSLKAILHRCLEKNPAHRFSSALELANALIQWPNSEF